MISAIFHVLVRDLELAGIELATLPLLDETEGTRIARMIVLPQVRERRIRDSRRPTPGRR